MIVYIITIQSTKIEYNMVWIYAARIIIMVITIMICDKRILLSWSKRLALRYRMS